MAFIGIVAEKQKYDFIRKNLLKDMNKNDITLININKNSINNLQRVKFDAIVILNSLDKVIVETQAINNICNNVKYFIINSDLEVINNPFSNITTNVITFGLNQKATVTFSSITDENMLISVQREFKTIQNKKVEQGEYSYKINKIDRTNIYEILIEFIIKKLFFF
ncbi:MAG: hypothetical protein IJH76_01770 [Clostridia bacterium]|nr:hypothetical protein [Clostridia bacterium]